MARLRANVVSPLAGTPRYGLVISARTPEDPPEARWEAGLIWEPETCDYVAIEPFCRDEEAAEKALLEIQENASYRPSVLIAGTRCGTMGNLDRDWVGKVTRALLATESFALEHELWTGEGALDEDNDTPNDFLAHPTNTFDIPGPAVSPIEGIALLEGRLAACSHGEQGMIHVTPQVATLLQDNGVTRREANRILTVLDTIIVPGSGYPGTDPDGNVGAGNVWAYATKMVDVRRGEILTPGSGADLVDRSQNSIIRYAERTAAATFDPCCHFGVQLDVDPAGEGS